MVRNPNSFTKRQLKFLEAIQDKIREINDSDKPYISHTSYSFKVKHTKQFGKIPKIVFTSHGTQVKGGIIRNAGFVNKSRDREIQKIRTKMGFINPRDKEHRILARLFEAEWNNIMLKAKKATFTVALINNLFASGSQQVADPVSLLQSIVMDEYNQDIKTDKKKFQKEDKTKDFLPDKNYEDELMEIQN